MMAHLRQLHLGDNPSAVVAAMDNPLLAEWELAQSRRRSPRTIQARSLTVQLLARRQAVDPVTADWQSIARFLDDPAFSRGTVLTYFSALRAWYGWLVRQGVRADNPTDRLEKPTAPRRYPRPISTEELGRVLRRANRRRTRAMVILGAYEGMRVHEIAKIRGQDFHAGGTILEVTGKGGHTAPLPVHHVVAELRTGFPRIGWWFPSYADPAVPVTAKNVSAVISGAMHRAGVDGTGHQLRHWYGTTVLTTAGGNLRVAQQAMRHGSIASTAIYTLISDEQVRAAVSALPVPLHAVR
ncbi:MAG: tyrosine-type recombinase/integrase [Mycobacterium sp.]|nr:tyrosine-type recombinase/integrase [Mycobacterium sp.]